MKILLVEDERYIAEPVEEILKKNNYSVDLAFDGEYGLDCGLTGIYDIIILDIMLPKLDGISVLKELRKERVKSHVIMLSALGQTEDKVKGLDCGADDYLAKPFRNDELLARLRALSRRSAEINPDGILNLGNTYLNPHTLKMSCEGFDSPLTLKESQLLELFILRKSITVSKETIIEKLWGYDTDAEDNNVETYVSLLRKKLGQIKSDISIRTIRGAGYVAEQNVQ